LNRIYRSKVQRREQDLKVLMAGRGLSLTVHTLLLSMKGRMLQRRRKVVQRYCGQTFGWTSVYHERQEAGLVFEE
jgi:hypothetical protein